MKNLHWQRLSRIPWRHLRPSTQAEQFTPAKGLLAAFEMPTFEAVHLGNGKLTLKRTMNLKKHERTFSETLLTPQRKVRITSHTRIHRTSQLYLQLKT